MTQPTIVAMGGGGFMMEPDNPLLDDYILELARHRRGRDRPNLCFVPTAGGDCNIGLFYATFARRTEASHLALFDRNVDDLNAFLLEQDAIYVAGGSTANMLAIWRLHGVDIALARAWEAGVILAGLSAGSNCWFEAATTDSFGELAAFHDGLGFLPGSHSPHYDGELKRRPLFQRLIGAGELPDGYAADDGAALVFDGTRLTEVVASRPNARGYRVVRGPAGEAIETELPTRYLG